jgi:hypothetical protein
MLGMWRFGNLSHLNKLTYSKNIYGKQTKKGWVPVTHVCNPSYSGDRNQANYVLKPWASSS